MAKTDLYIQHRYAARDIGRAIIGAMEFMGKSETVWIVKAPRGEYVCVATPAPWGQIKVPQCAGILYWNAMHESGRAVQLSINFGPGTLPEREETLCRGSAS